MPTFHQQRRSSFGKPTQEGDANKVKCTCELDFGPDSSVPCVTEEAGSAFPSSQRFSHESRTDKKTPPCTLLMQGGPDTRTGGACSTRQDSGLFLFTKNSGTMGALDRRQRALNRGNTPECVSRCVRLRCYGN